MEDRHLFRGICIEKTCFNGKFIFGNRVDIGGKIYIHPIANATNVSESGIAELLAMHLIDPETLGQCTGLKEKSGTLIFEDDILRYGEAIRVVRWSVKHMALFSVDSEGYGTTLLEFNEYASNLNYSFEIIGNIYENKELLEAQQ